MQKLLFTMIVLFSVCGNPFSQSENNILENLISQKICFEEHFDNRRLFRNIKIHERHFKRKWMKYHVLLGKTANRKIFDNMEWFYVPRYEFERIDSTEIWLRPAKYSVGDMIFVYGDFYLGDYCYGRCNTLTHKHIHNKYRHTLNYGVVSGHYSCYKVDKSFMLDFFEKGFPVFSLNIQSDEKAIGEGFWFSTDGYDNPIKFPKNEIWKLMLHYDLDSEYKSKFY